MWIAIHAFALTFVTLLKISLTLLGGLSGAAVFLLIFIGLAVSLSSGAASRGH